MTVETEVQTERRLAREARNVYLGPLYHEECFPDASGATTVRVEVSYGWWNDGARAGWHRVFVPSREPTGDEYADMADHPATLAGDVARAHLEKLGERHGWDFWEVDDVSSD